MYFYILIIPALIVMIIVIYRSYRNIQQKTALYRFCDFRREVMEYMRCNYEDMSFEEYEELRRLLASLSKEIHYFDDLKINLFKYKIFKEIVWKVVDNTKKIEKKHFKYESVKNFKQKYVITNILAFADLIPFFKWKSSALLISMISTLLLTLGKKSFRLWASWFDEKLNNYGLSKGENGIHMNPC